MTGEDITIMIFTTLFGGIAVIAIIANILSAIKKGRKRKEQLTQAAKDDNYYEIACNGVYDVSLLFTIIGNAMYCKNEKIAYINEDENVGDFFTIILKHSAYQRCIIDKQKIFIKVNEINSIDISKPDSNIKAFAVRFIMCKNIMLTAIANNEKYDNCIILVPDRKRSTLDIMTKVDGKLTHEYKIEHLNSTELSDLPLYYMMAFDSFRNDFKFGHISLYTGIASIYPDQFAHKFRIMTGFNPEFHRTYDYDY